MSTKQFSEALMMGTVGNIIPPEVHGVNHT